ncbi:hypothetical protein [Acetobacter ghanensis]|uniref:DUF1134 domain-containing protein n=1 Tax=Acetobacter ghanensis TaxID=431306 RepID=A0A0U5F0H7_9PROT|nr:hypothetical protein [Acetobacter ghanensis]NHO40127.1 hypothetical protein [Acetobacter ghanensis]GBQ45779.1 hypothetical protein AA18895_0576 [Acetobacter ghanensis DSM 18895]CEF54120.1 hypothetical protein AGA_595 [Acetobacter ghanensis]
MRFSSVVAAAALAVSFGAASAAHAADTLGAPTAKLTLTAKSADIGLGYTWGDGTLTYAGKAHAFSITGGTIAAVGFSKIEGTGTVYNLHRLKDFNGTYAAAHGEATLGQGLGGAVLENKNGVRIKIETISQGARLAGSAQGLTLTLK